MLLNVKIINCGKITILFSHNLLKIKKLRKPKNKNE